MLHHSGPIRGFSIGCIRHESSLDIQKEAVPMIRLDALVFRAKVEFKLNVVMLLL